MREWLGAAGESMHGPTVSQQPFSQGEAEALGGAGDESEGHF